MMTRGKSDPKSNNSISKPEEIKRKIDDIKSPSPQRRHRKKPNVEILEVIPEDKTSEAISEIVDNLNLATTNGATNIDLSAFDPYSPTKTTKKTSSRSIGNQEMASPTVSQDTPPHLVESIS